VRVPLSFVCFYIDAGFFIPWVKAWQHANAAMGPACGQMNKDFFRLQEKNHYKPNCNLTSYRSNDNIVDVPHGTCLLDKAVTNWNFLPFRLRSDNHKNAKCVTVTTQSLPLQHRECIDSIRVDEFINDYTASQLFSFHPLSSLPQYITSGTNRREIYHTIILTIHTSDTDTFHGCLTVIGSRPHNMKIVKIQKCRPEEIDQHQLFRVYVVSKKGRPYKILPNKVSIIINWIGEDEKQCLSLQVQTFLSPVVIVFDMI
jgi:hypothetical protein